MHSRRSRLCSPVGGLLGIGMGYVFGRCRKISAMADDDSSQRVGMRSGSRRGQVCFSGFIRPRKRLGLTQSKRFGSNNGLGEFGARRMSAGSYVHHFMKEQRMKRARVGIIAAAVFAVAAVAFAHAKPDFSGTWTLDPDARGWLARRAPVNQPAHHRLTPPAGAHRLAAPGGGRGGGRGGGGGALGNGGTIKQTAIR